MMKLAILGGGGVRVPAFIRSVVSQPVPAFDRISLFEPDGLRRETTGRLAAELAGALGHPGVVRVTADAEEAFSGADFVFSALRVGGDRGRVIDEEVALKRGLVGQETTGAGGCAMALRTVPVMLSYCEILARCAPNAVLINFTNPVGLITQAISLHARVRAIGVCDTPAQTLADLAAFLGAEPTEIAYSYSGLNHLGWISSFSVAGEEQIGGLLARFEELQRFSHRFAAFDPALVRRLGAVPTEYVYYFYDPKRYVDAVARAGASRGRDVVRLNQELLAGIAKAFGAGDVRDAWSAYSMMMSIRHDTYMRADMDGDNRLSEVRAQHTDREPEQLSNARPGGYEGVALQVIDGLTARKPGVAIVNTRNATSLGFLDPDDVVEVPSVIHGSGVAPLSVTHLPRSASALVSQVKEYEREVVDAAVSGSADMAAIALAGHPLVPGLTAARELISEYRDRHGPHLDYLR
jgi:6-phospho-beta-glucosidase